MKSKYLGMVFDNCWTVIRASKADATHTRFTLVRPTSDNKAYKHITLMGNELARIARGERTVESYLSGKLIQKNKFKRNIFRNNIFYVFEKRGE